jgi:peroxiredoxin
LDTVLLVVRLLLSLVFLAAGVAKLADRARTRQAVADFGVPSSIATPIATLLPIAELGIGLALIPASSAWWGAVGACGLLGAFIVGIGINLARGRTPDCRCFGQVHSAPIGWQTLVRNALLAGAGSLIVVQGRADPQLSVGDLLQDLSAQEVALLVAGVVLVGAVILGGTLLFGLLRQNGRLLLRIEALEQRLSEGADIRPDVQAEEPSAGLPVGSKSPGFTLSGIRGETLTLDFFTASQKPTLLVFARPGCAPCEALVPELERWQEEHSLDMSVVVISEGTPEINREKFGRHRLPFVLVQRGREVAQGFHADGTPSAVVIRPDGTVGSHLAEGSDQIRRLIQQTIGAAHAPTRQPLPVVPGLPAGNGGGNGAAPAPAGVAVGQAAPSITLADVHGRQVDIANVRGKKTLLLFWNPGCGFCQQMLDDLKAWEANRDKTAPRLVVVSTGSVEANKALGLKSPVLLDQNFTVAPAFGANGTPMAVLLDERGRVASRLAVGGPEVLALARGELDPVA